MNSRPDRAWSGPPSDGVSSGGTTGQDYPGKADQPIRNFALRSSSQLHPRFSTPVLLEFLNPVNRRTHIDSRGFAVDPLKDQVASRREHPEALGPGRSTISDPVLVDVACEDLNVDRSESLGGA